MPPLPDVTTSIQDKGLGLLPPSAANAVAIIGPCTGGTVNTVYAFNDTAALVSTLTSGPAVEAAALALSQSGHGTVYVVPVNASVAGAAGSTTYTRIASGGPSTGLYTLSGSALDAYNVVITIVAGGTNLAAATATFTYSLDGGNTASAVTAVPTGGTFVIPGTGLTITFANGGGPTSFIAGDVGTATVTAPFYSGTDATAAFNALVANANTWRCVLFVGAASTASAAATLAGTIQSLMATAESNFRYAYAVVQSNDTDGNNTSAFASYVGVRVVVCAGQAWITSPLTGRVSTRDASWIFAARVPTRPVSEDPGRVATGALSGVSKLLRDEGVTPALDALRFTTLRTIVNLQGFYITDGNVMAASGSDFALVQNRQVMDVACTVARSALLTFLNATVRVTATGAINELDAQRIENYVAAQLRAALVSPGDASSVAVIVNRTANVLSTRTIPVTIRVVPDGYGKFITNNIGFSNPALALPFAH